MLSKIGGIGNCKSDERYVSENFDTNDHIHN